MGLNIQAETNLSKFEESLLAGWPHPMLGEGLSKFGNGERIPEIQIHF